MNDETRRTYHRGRWHRVENALMSVATRAGLIPHSYLLTTTGRKTGQLHSNPVTIVERAGHRWLVAPYGVVPWVLNARAAGEVRLTRRTDVHTYAVREVSAEEAGPVLQRYVQLSSVVRPYFSATTDAPLADFVAEAHAHPVFELLPTHGQAAGG